MRPRKHLSVLRATSWLGIALSVAAAGGAAAANYDVTLRFKPIRQPAAARFELGAVKVQQPIHEGSEVVLFQSVSLPAGPAQLEAYLAVSNAKIGVMFVEVLRRQGAKP